MVLTSYNPSITGYSENEFHNPIVSKPLRINISWLKVIIATLANAGIMALKMSVSDVSLTHHIIMNISVAGYWDYSWVLKW